MIALREHLTFGKAGIVTETLDEGNGKSLYRKGIFIQGAIVNENGRNYPTHEISSAVKNIQQRISEGYSVLGEADHPALLEDPPCLLVQSRLQLRMLPQSCKAR